MRAPRQQRFMGRNREGGADSNLGEAGFLDYNADFPTFSYCGDTKGREKMVSAEGIEPSTY